MSNTEIKRSPSFPNGIGDLRSEDEVRAARQASLEVRHTPGPWAVSPFDAQVVTFQRGNLTAICGLLWPTDTRSEEETYANARLIAAAPEMLASLEKMLEVYWQDDGAEPPRMILDARAAIAEAKYDDQATKERL